jgi:hypothetical protein
VNGRGEVLLEAMAGRRRIYGNRALRGGGVPARWDDWLRK